MKQKTIDYLKAAANNTDYLLQKAIEYREKYDSSTTSVGKLLYKNKLRKTVKKLETYMNLFQGMEEVKKYNEENPIELDKEELC